MRFDDDSWELLTREGGPITYNERSVIEDRDGNVWDPDRVGRCVRWDGSGWTHLDDAALTAESTLRMRTFEALVGRDDTLLRAVIHHDMHSDNILVDDRKRIVAVLDFDESYYGPAVIDLASLLLTWGLTDDRSSIDVEKSAQLIRRYSREAQRNHPARR